MTIGDETRRKAIRMLYAGAPRPVIMKELGISESTLKRIARQAKITEADILTPPPETVQTSEKEEGLNLVLTPGLNSDPLGGASAPIDREVLMREALKGMSDNVRRLNRLSTALMSMEGSDLVYSTVAVCKELRMTYSKIGDWGGLSVIETDRAPVSPLDDLAAELSRYREEP